MNTCSIGIKVPVKFKLQTFIITLLALSVFALYMPSASAEEDSSINIIYHVYIEGEHIGSLLDDEPVYTLIEELIDSHAEDYPDLTLQVGENVEVIPEFIFDEGSEAGDVLTQLEEKLTVQAEAVTLVIDKKPAVYLPSQAEAEKAVEALITQYVKEDDYEHFLEEEDLDHIDVGETVITDIVLTEDITEEEVLVAPDDIVSVKQAVKKLNKGVLEEESYQVKQGDVLSSIANDHGLTTSELIDLNEDLDADSIIRVGQEILVTAYQPLVEVYSTKVSLVEEEIAYETEEREDDSMWKGDTKVTQEGQPGTQLIEYEITEKNGHVVKREVLSEEVTKEPVKRIVTKGTKEMPSRGSGQLGWPAVGGYISSYQGNRWGRFHKGIDIARPSNYNILAADNGTVTQATYSGGYGNLVRINHNNGVETLYAHLASIDVEVGQTVTKGQKIGVMGSTGNSTGIHLHFEVYEKGQLKNPMDYLR
ncbi:M23 family metallopeptidase [Halalkalibacter krulwichiae]|uniref:Murein DD-endopeptidase MepM n=1 Tax=Halalkalibacter krulwichiae TaxID=199441 RepID=A0A1X9MLR2_9BACI|nr:M23 family metallopeptidase [Halalkalibacter krulwichiae]ARK32901.1 Murein DD-endopeptidase MepM [Halalkalibacter krulwichiae]